ncbi:MAG: hypothetical protein AAF371_17255 [Pseudomonadota bacterium]
MSAMGMRRVLAALVVLGLLAIIAAEIALRVIWGLGDPPLARPAAQVEYELVPAAEHRRFGNLIAINNRGMRTGEFADLPAVGERRILLIGDSVVYGTHRLDQSETIAARLEARLAPTGEGCSLRVLPLAVSSWGPVNQAAALRGSGLFGAGEVVIVVSAHDIGDLPSWQIGDIPYAIATPGLAIIDAAAVLARRRFGFRLLPWAPGPVAPPAPGVLPADSIAALGEMVSTARAAGARAILAYHGTLGEAGADAPPGRVAFERFAAEEGVPFLVLGERGLGPWAYADMIHPSAAGANAIAGILAAFLGGVEDRACDGGPARR